MLRSPTRRCQSWIGNPLTPISDRDAADSTRGLSQCRLKRAIRAQEARATTVAAVTRRLAAPPAPMEVRRHHEAAGDGHSHGQQSAVLTAQYLGVVQGRLVEREFRKRRGCRNEELVSVDFGGMASSLPSNVDTRRRDMRASSISIAERRNGFKPLSHCPHIMKNTRRSLQT